MKSHRENKSGSLNFKKPFSRVEQKGLARALRDWWDPSEHPEAMACAVNYSSWFFFALVHYVSLQNGFTLWNIHEFFAFSVCCRRSRLSDVENEFAFVGSERHSSIFIDF